MTAATNYLETAIFNVVFRNTAFTPPASVYLALFTSTATVADLEAGTTTNEVSTTSTAYARQLITFGAPSNGSASNSSNITFSAATASWGTVRYVGICDALTAGNLLWYAQLSSDITVNTGNTLQFASNTITPSVA